MILLAASLLTVGIGAAPIAADEIDDAPTISQTDPEADPEADLSVDPEPDADPEPAVELPAPSDLTECEEADIDCPPAPKLLSVTPGATAVAVEWQWASADDSAPLTGTLLRIQPGSVSATFATEARAGTLSELQADTEYTVIAYAIVDDRLSSGSEPIVFRTLADASAKPFAQPGDVSRLIVTMQSENNPSVAATAASADLPVDGVEVDEVRDLGNKTVVMELDEGISNTDAALVMDDLLNDPRVASVEIDARVELMTFPASPPNDPYWADGSLWGLFGTYGIGIGSNVSTMRDVWSRTQGSGAVVAVLDTGYTPHPDLDANRVAGYDFVSNFAGSCRGAGVTDGDGDYVNVGVYGALGWDNNPLDPGDWKTVTSVRCGVPRDSIWHGMHVAGTIAATANNTVGIVGVAPQAKIQPVRVMSYDGGLTSDIVAAITWASGGTITGVPANPTPADVINLSLGGTSTCTDAWQTAIDAAVGRGSVIVAAAGNSNIDASNVAPANCNNVITVAATGTNGNRASFSNFGSSVDIAAPGVGIWSTADSGAQQPAGATYLSYNGTSMAAPHVAGVAALLKSLDRSITPSAVLTTLRNSVTPFPATGNALQCTTSVCGSGLLSATAVSSVAPRLTSITPTSGSTSGGTAVTLTGVNLTGATGVTFAGVPATSLTVTSSTSATMTTPVGAAGAGNVTITTPSGSSTLPNAFTFVAPAPPSSGGGGGGGSSAGSGSSSAGDSGGGGGGGVNAIQTINPASSGAPGTVIALAGWGLETTRAVNFNEFSAAFTVVNGGHVEVTVPDIPAGIYVVHAILAPDVGRASFWDGFSVTARGAASPAPTPGATPIPGAPGSPGEPVTATPSADVIAFTGTSTSLTPATRTKLDRLAEEFSGVPVQGTIVAFTDARGTARSTRGANTRAQNIRRYLTQTGLNGSLTITTQQGSTALQSRSSLIFLAPASSSASTTSGEVSSLIVRVKKGKSITVNGTVRGANRVTGAVRNSLSVGPNLGLRMYRIDFAEPVSERVARRVAIQLMRDPGIEFAEPNSIVRMMNGSTN